MTSKRMEKVGDLLRKEISAIILRDLKDPEVGFVTITGVSVTADLRIARVYFSVIGSSQEKAATLRGLLRASGFIRRLLSGRIMLRNTPELHFKVDDSLEYGKHIEELLERVKG